MRARALGRWLLDEVDRQRPLTQVPEHDPDPAGTLAEEIHWRIIATGNRAGARALAAVARPGLDVDDTVVLFLGSLVSLRRTAWTFGAAPLALEDDRALDAWVELVLVDCLPPAPT